MSYLHMVFCCTAMCAVQSHPNPAGKCRVAFQASIQLTRATVRPNNVPTAKDSAAICFFPTMSCRLQKGSCGAATCNQSAVCPDGMHFIRVLSNQRQCLVTFQAMFKLLSTSVKRKVGINILWHSKQPQGQSVSGHGAGCCIYSSTSAKVMGQAL